METKAYTFERLVPSWKGLLDDDFHPRVTRGVIRYSKDWTYATCLSSDAPGYNYRTLKCKNNVSR